MLPNLTFTKRTLVAAAMSACLTQAAQAGIVVNLYEDGGIKADYSGYLNIPQGVTGTSTSTTSAGLGGFNPGYPAITFYTSGITYSKYSIWTEGPDNFGTGAFSGNLTSAVTGSDLLALEGSGAVYLASDYVSGTNISGSWVATNTNLTLSGKGAAAGTYLWYYGELTEGEAADGQFLKLIVTHGPKPTSGGGNNVPAPATPLLIAAGLLGGGVGRRLARQNA